MPDLATHVVTSVLALTAAAQFAAGALLVKRGLAYTNAVTGAYVSIVASFIVYVIAAPFALEWRFFLSPAVWVFAGIGVLRPSLTSMLAYEGTRRLGPTVATTFETMSPLFATAGGVLFLSERLTAVTMLGTLGVVGGAMVLTVRGRLPRSWPLWAVLLPLGAAMIRSGAHVAARWGLLMLPSVVMSGLVAYGVSTVVAGVVLLARPRRAPQPLTREGLIWFSLVGLTNAGAIFALNSALAIGEVVVVSPVVAAYPVFTMAGSWLFYRNEPITRRTVLGVLVVVASVVLIILGR